VIGEGPWLGEPDDVTVRHGVSLLHWRRGGVGLSWTPKMRQLAKCLTEKELSDSSML
jgi:hypothetical protein